MLLDACGIDTSERIYVLFIVIALTLFAFYGLMYYKDRIQKGEYEDNDGAGEAPKN